VLLRRYTASLLYLMGLATTAVAAPAGGAGASAFVVASTTDTPRLAACRLRYKNRAAAPNSKVPATPPPATAAPKNKSGFFPNPVVVVRVAGHDLHELDLEELANWPAGQYLHEPKELANEP
jgi:hypothetical protein